MNVAQGCYSVHVKITAYQSLLPAMSRVIVDTYPVGVHQVDQLCVDRITILVRCFIAGRRGNVGVITVVKFPVFGVAVSQLSRLPGIGMFKICLVVVAKTCTFVRSRPHAGGAPVLVFIHQGRFFIIQVALHHDFQLLDRLCMVASYEHFRRIIRPVEVAEAVVAGIIAAILPHFRLNGVFAPDQQQICDGMGFVVVFYKSIDIGGGTAADLRERNDRRVNTHLSFPDHQRLQFFYELIFGDDQHFFRVTLAALTRWRIIDKSFLI